MTIAPVKIFFFFCIYYYFKIIHKYIDGVPHKPSCGFAEINMFDCLLLFFNLGISWYIRF